MLQRGIKHIVCAISGGVDSAVAAILLKNKGYHVTGVFMRNWDVQDENDQCSFDEALGDAAYVCKNLDIDLHEVNFVKEYWNNVFSTMIREYETARTPNPDILCNKYIKFDAFHDYAVNRLGADYVATGHYARTSGPQQLDDRDTSKGVKLLRGVDNRKDQTFFLAQIHQQALRRTTFPIGDMMKDVVKKIAAASGLETIARKRESYGICFIGKRDFHSFIDEYIESKNGSFIDIETGKVLGEHRGVHRYTIGQCIRLGGLRHQYFVVSRNHQTQEIQVAPGTNHPALFTDTFVADPPHWIHDPPVELSRDQVLRCTFKYQHMHPMAWCSVQKDEVSDHVIVKSDQPMRAVTVGQYVVLYQEDVCLGSACVTHTGQNCYQRTGRSRPIENPAEFA